MSELHQFSNLSEKLPGRQKLNELVGKFTNFLEQHSDPDIRQNLEELDETVNADGFLYLDSSLIQMAKELEMVYNRDGFKDGKHQVIKFVQAIFSHWELVENHKEITRLSLSVIDLSISANKDFKKKSLNSKYKFKEICKMFVSFELKKRQDKTRCLVKELDVCLSKNDTSMSDCVKLKSDLAKICEMIKIEEGFPKLAENPTSEKFTDFSQEYEKIDCSLSSGIPPNISDKPTRKSIFQEVISLFKRGKKKVIKWRNSADSKKQISRNKFYRSSRENRYVYRPTRGYQCSLACIEHADMDSYVIHPATDDEEDVSIVVELPNSPLPGVVFTENIEKSVADYQSASSSKIDIPEEGTGSLENILRSENVQDIKVMTKTDEPSVADSSYLIHSHPDLLRDIQQSESGYNSASSSTLKNITERNRHVSCDLQGLALESDSHMQRSKNLQESRCLSFHSLTRSNFKSVSNFELSEKPQDKKEGERISKSEIISKRSIIGRNENDTRRCIEAVVDDVNKSKVPIILEELEICGSNLTKEQLEALRRTGKTLCKIRKMIVGYTKNMRDLIPSCCLIINEYNISCLSLESDDLEDCDIKVVSELLEENETLEELDISTNRAITSKGYEHIGRFVSKNSLRILKVADCNLSGDDFSQLFSSLENTKLEELDLSCNEKFAKLKDVEYEMFSRFVIKSSIKRVILSECDLDKKTLATVFQHLKKDHQQTLIGATTDEASADIKPKNQLEELDVSYNPTMEVDAYRTLGSMVKICKIKKLGLAGCELNQEKLEILGKEIKECKMTSISARDNSSIARGIAEFGSIIKACQLEEFDISDCMLVFDELGVFKKELEDLKLKKLTIGDYGRELKQKYVSKVCELLPNINGRLYLKFGIMRRRCREMLRKHFGNQPQCQLEIFLNGLSLANDIPVEQMIPDKISQYATI